MSERRRKKEAKRAARKELVRRQQPVRVQRDGRGTAHLVVLRDPLGRPQRLALSAPIFAERWQNDVAVAAASTAHGLMAQGSTLANVVKLARSAMAATSQLGEAALARASESQLACRSGCAHCCYQAVGVSPPEVFAIHEHLRATRSLGELDHVARRIREADDGTRGMSLAERFSPDWPCPFLTDGACSIYEARPLSCRGKNSLDASACEQTLRDPEARAELFAGTRAVPCYLEPIRAFHAVSAGMELSLHELHGLHVAPLELTAALRVLIDDPDGVSRAWLAGEDPFRAARGGDSTDDPRIKGLSGRI